MGPRDVRLMDRLAVTRAVSARPSDWSDLSDRSLRLQRGERWLLYAVTAAAALLITAALFVGGIE